MQTASLETALRLKKLGKVWPLEFNSSFAYGEGGPVMQWSGQSLQGKSYVVLPRLDQVLDEIERRVPGEDVEITFLWRNHKRVCDVSRFPENGFSQPVAEGIGLCRTEVAGKCLIYVLEAQNG